MEQKKLLIQGIPAILWGKSSDRIYLYVHGKQSRKEYAQSFAALAEAAGCQTLSFDLPEHGERAGSPERCDVWQGKQDLGAVADFVFARWSQVSLFACSLGAYFSLEAYAGRPFRHCLFQSPIVDMQWLVEHMMLWSGVTESMLEAQGEIETPIDTLCWDYYCYIKAHPVGSWNIPTSILYGGLDNLQPRESIEAFAEKFRAELTVSPNSQHPFMEPADGEIVRNWLETALKKEG